ncbi:hypothetical protein ACE103_17650 [Bradyrhizobium sp. ma5]|uniref:hypothetical protein n=1 Tax=Bradyrhizobium sp. ma5 TaxID=3344828 RepID=UPI0035D49EBE
MTNITVRRVGAVTSTVLGNENEEFTGDTEVGFRDREELMNAFKDPQYARSEYFRQRVAEAMAATMSAKPSAGSLLDGGQLRGSFQVRGQPMDEAPAAERQLTAHELEMIAKAEKHGL